MQRPWMLALWLAVLSFFAAHIHEAGCAMVRSQSTAAARGDEGGDDGGDDGGLGGLAGALTGMMGGGGGGGGGADDDDDPNMVGGKKKADKDVAKGVDTNGLENALQTGGIGSLTSMLNAMRAAQGNSDTHIKKGPNGEDMYDFRDLDDGFTTPKPIVMAQPMTMAPILNAVAVPAAPSISLPGKGGKIKGLTAAEAKMAAEQSKLVVWPPAPPATQAPVAAPVAPMVAAPPLGAAPVFPAAGQQQVFPAVGQQPVFPAGYAAPFAAPQAPMAASNLYQGLAAMSQNMQALMNQIQSGALGGGNRAAAGNTAALEAKIDQLSHSFASEEKTLETKIDSLEGENKEMKKELTEQADEIKQLSHGTRTGKAKRANLVKTSGVKAAAYATKPWDATFSVHLDGKAGGKEETFTVRVHPEWAPEGAKRFQDIVQDGLLQEARFFRVVPNFMVQFGIPGAPQVAAKWSKKRIPDDPPKKSNTRGMMTFAMSGPNTRTTQMFVNFANNAFLDNQGFAPFAEVLGDGMKVVDRVQSKYKERPNQAKIQHHGNKYLMKHFADLSYIGHVDSTLTSAPKAAGFLQQDSQAPEAAPEEELQGHQSFRYGGIATFFHRKHKVGN